MEGTPPRDAARDAPAWVAPTADANDTQLMDDLSSWNQTAFHPYEGSFPQWPSPTVYPITNDSDLTPADCAPDQVAAASSSGAEGHIAAYAHVMEARRGAIASCDEGNPASLSSIYEGSTSYDVGGEMAPRRDLRQTTVAKRNKVDHQADSTSSLVTPASQIDLIHTAPAVPAIEASGHLAAVTPHEHDASMALATLRLKSDMPKSPKAAQRPTRSGTAALIKAAAADYQPTFPELVHAMVTESTAFTPNVIEWVHDGKAFIIHDKGPQLGHVLLKHFRHRNYSSLQRQLNMYGWKKHLSGEFKGTFHNPLFHRDNSSPSQLARIRRRAKSDGAMLPPVQEAKRRVSAGATLPPVQEAKRRVSSRKKKGKNESVKGGSPDLLDAAIKEQPPTKNSPKTNAPNSFVKPVVPNRGKGPLKQRLKRAGFDTPVRAKGATTALRLSASVSPQQRAALWNYDVMSYSPADHWSPLIDTRRLPDLVDERKPAARDGVPVDGIYDHAYQQRLLDDASRPVRTEFDPVAGRIRMTLFAGKSCHTSPVDPSAAHSNGTQTAGISDNRVLPKSGQDDSESVAGHDYQQKIRPSPISSASVESASMPPALPLARNVSSSFFIPMPVPLQSSTSSTFFLPFVGMTNALTHALGVSPQGYEDHRETDGRPDGIQNSPSAVSRLHCDEYLAPMHSSLDYGKMAANP